MQWKLNYREPAKEGRSADFFGKDRTRYVYRKRAENNAGHQWEEKGMTAL